MAESTGRLPPTPTDQQAASDERAIQFGDPPPARAKAPVMSSVILKEILVGNHMYMSRRQAKRKGSLSAPDICTNSPKSSSYEKANVLTKLEEWSIEFELVDDRWKNQASNNLRGGSVSSLKRPSHQGLPAKGCLYSKG